MKSAYILLLLMAFIATSGSAIAANKPEATPSLQLVEMFPAPDVEGRLDHLTVDPNHIRIFVSGLGNDSIEVFDFSKAKWIMSIKGMNEPKGILYLPEFQKLFCANVGDGTLKVLDNSYHVIRTIVIGKEADYLRYDPVSKKIITSYGDKKDEGGLLIIDPVTYEMTTIKMEAPAEDFAIDETGRYIYANLHSASATQLVDRTTGKLTRWDYQNAQRPTPMALNAKEHRLYIAARGPADLLVINTDTGKEVSRIPLGGISADLLFDREAKRLYNINSAGYINVIQERDADHYELVENVPTAIGARTGYLIPAIARLLIAVPAYGDRPAGLWEYQTNSFK